MDIIQFKITLSETNPPIWRRVLVEKNTSFKKFHHIIQAVMGWGNSHLHEFSIAKSKATLGSVITDKNQGFGYIYDFGDYWEHEIQAEKFLPMDSKVTYPICTAGKLNCPPEDCGGIPGFYNMLDILSQKRHPEKKDYLEWLGGKYDPKLFDINEINLNLKSL
jgi:hypothetical protein